MMTSFYKVDIILRNFNLHLMQYKISSYLTCQNLLNEPHAQNQIVSRNLKQFQMEATIWSFWKKDRKWKQNYFLINSLLINSDTLSLIVPSYTKFNRKNI